MPLPTPNKGEERSNFVERCMSNSVIKKEFPDNKQALAVCFSQYKKRKQAKGSEPYWAEVEEECVADALKDKGIFEIDIPSQIVAKTKVVCDACGLHVDLSKAKPEKGKDGKVKPAKPNPAIRATLEYPVGSGETQPFEFCNELCLLNFLKKRY